MTLKFQLRCKNESVVNKNSDIHSSVTNRASQGMQLFCKAPQLAAQLWRGVLNTAIFQQVDEDIQTPG